MTHLKLWVDHCKQYAKDNGLKYSECLKNDNCRKMYHDKKASSKVSQPEVEVNLELIKKSIGKRKSSRS
jgi:hypothetical protein